MKTAFFLCMAFCIPASAHALTPTQQVFIDQLPLSPTLQHTTCRVDMKPLLSKATHWKGRVTEFYDRYIGSLEWEKLERENRNSPEPPNWSWMRYNGTSPDMDEPCLREAFPSLTIINRTPDDDPLMAYLKARYLFETFGCKRYDEAIANLMEAAEFKRDDDTDTFRMPDSYYRMSVMTLKCTGDVEAAYKHYLSAGQHGWPISPPAPIKVPPVSASDLSLLTPTHEEIEANRLASEHITEENARTREAQLLACWGYRPQA